MKVSLVDGTKLWFDIEGMGLVPDGDTMRQRPTLVVMHGGPGGDHNGFKPTFTAIADTCQVLYYDHRGHGRSDRSTPDHWNLDRWADDLVEMCDALAIERPFVLGLSFGGFVAQRLASRHPGFAAGHIFLSTAATKDSEAIYDMFGRLGGPEAADTARAFWEAPDEAAMAAMVLRYVEICGPLYTQTPGNPFLSRRTIHNNDVLTHFNHHEGPHLNLLPELALVRDPVLIAHGELDPVTPMVGAERMAEALPEGLVEFARFAGSGHGVFRDEPDAFFAVLRSFITVHWPPQPD
jgi:proline iminopeptidase